MVVVGNTHELYRMMFNKYKYRSLKNNVIRNPQELQNVEIGVMCH